MKPIRTQRLFLIPLSRPQLETSLYSPRVLSNNLGVPLVSRMFEGAAEHAIKMKIKIMDSLSPSQNHWVTYWVIVILKENIGVGLAGFKGIPDENGSVEIGYAIDELYRRKGYMTEAVKALVDWAFTQPDCNAITALGVLPKNIGSHKVLKKVGFIEIKSTPEAIDYQLVRNEMA
jgi:GNAT superfamily N-acetyltransferase